MHSALAAPPEPLSGPRTSRGALRRYANPLVVALALIAVQVVVRGWVAGRGYFYWDDLILAGRAGRYPLFSTDVLLYNHDGHFMPAAFAVAWIITRLAPYVWAGPVISMLVLQLGASVAVLRMLLVLGVPGYGSRKVVVRGPGGPTAERAPRGPSHDHDAEGLVTGHPVEEDRASPRSRSERWAALGGRTRWVILLPLVFYLFCPLTLPAFAWWSASLNALPLQFALAWVAGDAVLLVRSGRRRYAVSGCLVLLVALLFFEKSVIVPFVAIAAAALARYVDGEDRAIRVVIRRAAGLWIGSAAVLGGWIAVYFTAVHHISVVRSPPAGVRALLHHAISRGIVPALLGGPWGWERWMPSTPWAVPPGWTVGLAWIVLGLVAVQSIRTRLRVLPVLLAVVAYVVAAQLPIALIRGGPNTTAELSQSLRYLADLTVPLTIAGALLLRARPRRPGPRALRPVVVGALAVAFMVSSLWSTWTFGRSWSASPTRTYLTNVKSALAAGGAPLLEQELPWDVLNPLTYPLNRISVALSPLAPATMFAHATPHLRMIADDGRIVDAAVWWNRGILPGPAPGCGYRIATAQPVPIPLDGPMIDNAWTAQLNYLAGRDGYLTVALEHGETVLAPVRKGLHTVYVRIIGHGSVLRIGSPTPGLNLCLGVGPIGVASYGH
ncbi:hypothetical protein ABIA39_002556 [Nocardia sp. GAS34]|uniref:hypothetical protein n=1 Tax=unclassified Nocardia TaxID=2637762 RepID=UPI003D22254E